MNCAQHSEVTATAFCRECGKPMCQECQRPALGSVYCETHLPAAAQTPYSSAPYESAPPPASYPPPQYTPPPTTYTTQPASSPYTAPVQPDDSVHPILALILGLIPGVGAIYNGQYAKGLVHAVVFGLLVSTVANSRNGGMAALVGIMIAAWVFYMAFEAYHTARKRRFGIAVDEFAGQLDFRSGGGRIPTGAIVLIGLGFLLLLDTTDIISFDQFEQYWPAGLIVFGLWLLYSRLHENSRRDAEAER